MRRVLFVGVLFCLVGCGKSPDQQAQVADIPSKNVANEAVPNAGKVPDIKGLKLGDSQSDISAKYPDAQCHAQEGRVLCQVNGQGYGGSESGILQIALDNGHAVMIAAQALEGDKFELIVTAMTTKFGSPDDEAHRPARANASEITWTGKDWLLVASPHDAGTSFVGVTLVDTTWMQAKLDASVSGAAKDL